jgi:hypothetical protein
MKTKLTNWKWMMPLAAVALAATPALAGEGGANGGNGGDAIVCKLPSGKVSVELLDYYEARTQLKDLTTGQSLQLDFGAPGLSASEIVDLLISRIAAVSPMRAERYREQAQAFMAETSFLPDADLTDIPDSQHVAVPKNCEIKQMVIQRKTPFAMQSRYTVDQTLWALLSEANKAGTILHEIIYREAIELGQSNSIPTRYFNARVASNLLPRTDQERYQLFGQELKFGTFEPALGGRFKSGNYASNAPQFHPAGNLALGAVALNTELTLPVTGNSNVTAIHAGQQCVLAFAPAGALLLQESQKHQVRYCEMTYFVSGGPEGGLALEDVTFYPSGALQSGRVTAPSVRYPVRTVPSITYVELMAANELRLAPNGAFLLEESFSSKNDYELVSAAGCPMVRSKVIEVLRDSDLHSYRVLGDCWPTLSLRLNSGAQTSIKVERIEVDKSGDRYADHDPARRTVIFVPNDNSKTLAVSDVSPGLIGHKMRTSYYFSGKNVPATLQSQWALDFIGAQ